MRDVLIETYRGYEIFLEKEKDCFSCSYENDEFESKSFKGIKKMIDDFIKDNNTFKVFKVEKLPSAYSDNIKYKVIGISHKTNKFQLEGMDGKKFFVAEYSEKDYVLCNGQNDIIKNEYYELRKQEIELSKKIAEVNRKYIIKSLKDIKGDYSVKQ